MGNPAPLHRSPSGTVFGPSGCRKHPCRERSREKNAPLFKVNPRSA